MRKIVSAVSALVIISASNLLVSSPAYGDSSKVDNYCVLVADGAPDSDGVTKDYSRACSTISEEEALKKLNSQLSEDGRPGISAENRLMGWFADRGFSGERTAVFGESGPCDSAGYKLSVPHQWASDWGNIMSSAVAVDGCNTFEVFQADGNYRKRFNAKASYFGNALNDNVGMIRVWRS